MPTKAYGLYEPRRADLLGSSEKTFYTLYPLRIFAVNSHAEIIAITGKFMRI